MDSSAPKSFLEYRVAQNFSHRLSAIEALLGPYRKDEEKQSQGSTVEESSKEDFASITEDRFQVLQLWKQIEEHLTMLETHHGVRVLPPTSRFQCASLLPMIASFSGSTETDEDPDLDSLLTSLPVEEGSHWWSAAKRFSQQQRGLSSTHPVPSDWQAAALSGKTLIPFSENLPRSKKYWESQLEAIEALQQQYEPRLGSFILTCERLLEKSHALFNQNPSNDSAAPSLATVLQQWLTYQPTYEFSSSGEEPDIPLHGKEAKRDSSSSFSIKEPWRVTPSEEAQVWSRIAQRRHSTSPHFSSALKKSVPEKDSSRKDLNDLLALCEENRERYSHIQRRWHHLRERFITGARQSNLLLCDITLKLDKIEEAEEEKRG